MTKSSTETLTVHQENPKVQTERPICCRACGQVVAKNSGCSQTEDSEKTFRNPAGYSFHVKMFDEAPGCVTLGNAVSEASWFPGYAWRLAMCGECDSHLGWRFEKAQTREFWGLIVTRLNGLS